MEQVGSELIMAPPTSAFWVQILEERNTDRARSSAFAIFSSRASPYAKSHLLSVAFRHLSSLKPFLPQPPDNLVSHKSFLSTQPRIGCLALNFEVLDVYSDFSRSTSFVLVCWFQEGGDGLSICEQGRGLSSTLSSYRAERRYPGIRCKTIETDSCATGLCIVDFLVVPTHLIV